MARSESDIQTDLDAVNSAIRTLVADPDGKLIDYAHGGRRFDKVKRLGEMRKLKKDYEEELAYLPSEEETILDEPWL